MLLKLLCALARKKRRRPLWVPNRVRHRGVMPVVKPQRIRTELVIDPQGTLRVSSIWTRYRSPRRQARTSAERRRQQSLRAAAATQLGRNAQRSSAASGPSIAEVEELCEDFEQLTLSPSEAHVIRAQERVLHFARRMEDLCLSMARLSLRDEADPPRQIPPLSSERVSTLVRIDSKYVCQPSLFCADMSNTRS